MSKTPATEHGQELLEHISEEIWRCELGGKTPAAAIISVENYEKLSTAAKEGRIRFQMYPSGVVSVAIVSPPVKIEE